MAVFDLAQHIVAESSGIIAGNTHVNDVGLSMLEASMMNMEVGPLFGLFLQSFFIGITMRILSIVTSSSYTAEWWKIYMAVSLAPVPLSTFGSREQSQIGQNYLRSLLALGLQGFLTDLCSHLCGADPECSHFRRCHRLHLEHRGVHGAAVLYPVQDQCRGPQHPERTLKGG